MLPKIAAAMSTIEGFHGLNLKAGTVPAPTVVAPSKAPAAVSSHDNAPTLPSSARASATPTAPTSNLVAAASPVSDAVPQVAQSAKKKRKRLAGWIS